MAAVALDELEPGPWIDELVAIEKRDGELTTEAVVTAARNPASSLYPYLTHDAAEALDKLNLIEAGRLIRRAEIVLTVEGGETHRVRAFLNVPGQGYRNTATTLSRREMREQVLGRMKADVEVMTNRYERYASIAEVSSGVKMLRRWLKAHGG